MEEHIRMVPYAFALGILMCLMLSTRLDICHAINMVDKYQSQTTILGSGYSYAQVSLENKDYMFVYYSEDLIVTGLLDFDIRLNWESY